MPFPPWRKAEYMRSKWLSSYTRASVVVVDETVTVTDVTAADAAVEKEVDSVEIELVFEEKCLSPRVIVNSSSSPTDGDDDVAVEREVKAVTGLASLFKEKP